MTISADNKQLLLVLGMHRSGTSALCAALAACGVSFGSRLIDPMAGVNDDGFWEDVGVVAINEELLALADSSWYAPAPGLPEVNWSSEIYQPLREQAAALLRAGFGDAPLQALKDPRLCLTLPFWLALCDELGIAARVCIISRAPLEVAYSLQRRDHFPVGYGLRLCATYWRCINRFTPADAPRVCYHELVQDAQAVMAGLAEVLPLAVADCGLADGVRPDLRHQAAAGDGGLLSVPDIGAIDLAALELEIESRFPVDETLQEFAYNLVARGLELERIGAEHGLALATIDQRDADIEALAAEHRTALATIDERDEQIREFDRRLSKLGAEHSYALEVLRQRDAELALLKRCLGSIKKLPVVGHLIKWLRKHA